MLSSLGEFSEYVKEVGRPYLWVQSLCGLQFLMDEEARPVKERAQASISASHMEETLTHLRQRVQARLSLQKQLASLGVLSQLLDCLQNTPLISIRY